ncbi:MAG: SH3 domain-containing protein [Patescibacteria group bacterium]|nr:SH3 domain-containing protein [Patescibacteria group bacterium]
MKKILFIIVPILLAIFIFIIIFVVVNKTSGKGALQVTSTPVSKVYVDSKFIGQTPLCKCEVNDMITVGTHTVRLIPTQGDLEAFEEKITITPSVLTVVDRTFGPGASSQGSVISLTPISDKKDAQVLVVTFPDKSQVFLDNNSSGLSPLLLKNLTISDHEIKVTKDGYKDKTLKIRTVLGYKLEALVFLGVNLAAATTSAIPSPSPAISPTPASNVKILILDTPTGFLRVRADSSLGSAEIGRVNPGETYDLLNETTGWYQIQLKDKTKGWVSSQYAKKQS